ncbi:unnamed protein product [marine sediment metagenome]|uniref:Uncharacterized protein n=2 Tax=marine sediment metagenome TaxID=412755 RepID=X1QU70_9ZZZZ
MQTIGTPMRCPELDLMPEQTGGIQLSDNMQQVLSLSAAFWRNQRVILKASPSGVLFTCSPELEDIFHELATQNDHVYQGANIKCSEVMVMGHPDNTGVVWARTKVAATVDNAWPLSANDVVGFTVTNLNMLHLLIKLDTEKAIIAYTM